MAKSIPKKVNQPSKQASFPHSPRAGFILRMGAYIIDIITVAVLLLFATALAVLIVIAGDASGLINLSVYQNISDYLAHSPVFAAYLAMLIVAFYSYFWSVKGQTRGMKICRLRVQNSDGSNISITQSLIRMATSAFGLGNFLAIFSDHNAFQDLWAECEVVVLTKR